MLMLTYHKLIKAHNTIDRSIILLIEAIVALEIYKQLFHKYLSFHSLKKPQVLYMLP